MTSLGPRNPLPQPEAIAELGRRLKQRRNELGLSLRRCADGHGFSYALLAKLESGIRNPTLATLLDLADALDMPLASLVDGLPFTPQD